MKKVLCLCIVCFLMLTGCSTEKKDERYLYDKNDGIIGAEAFAGCANLDSITIPQNDRLFEIKNGTFSGCSMMTAAIIPPSITYIDPYAFENCQSLSNTAKMILLHTIMQ